MLNFLFCALFLLFSLGMLGRISFLGQQVNGYSYEIVMLVLFFILLARYRFEPIVKAYRQNRFLFWFMTFCFVTFFFFWRNYSWQENLISFLYQIRFVFYFVFFFYSRDLIPKKAVDFFIVLVALISITQYFLYPDLRNLLYGGWDPHLYRLFGTYLDTYVAVVIYGLIFFYLLIQKRTLFNKIFLVCYLVFIIMTFSRIGYLAFLTTLLVIYLKDLKKFLFIALLAIIVLIALPKPAGEGVNLARVFSIDSRIADYRKGLGFWQKSPLLGIGYNRIRYIKKDLSSHSGASFHSSFMIILVGTGIIGFCLFLLAFAKFAGLGSLAPFFLIFVSLVSLGDNALLHPFVLFLMLSLIGVNPSHKQS